MFFFFEKKKINFLLLNIPLLWLIGMDFVLKADFQHDSHW